MTPPPPTDALTPPLQEPTAQDYEDKDWTFLIENVSGPQNHDGDGDVPPSPLTRPRPSAGVQGPHQGASVSPRQHEAVR